MAHPVVESMMTDKLTDDEKLTRACAMRFFRGRVSDIRQYSHIDGKLYVEPDNETGHIVFDPLNDDAQAMALGLTFPEQFEAAVCDWASMRRCGELNADLKRILCGFIARLP